MMAMDSRAAVPYSAVQYVRQHLGLKVCAIAKLADLMQYLAQHSSAGLHSEYQRVLAYRQRFGVDEDVDESADQSAPENVIATSP